MVGSQAADFASYLAAALDAFELPSTAPLRTESEEGARRAMAHARAESDAIWWYTLPIRRVAACQAGLRELGARWAKERSLAVSEVVTEACGALGFEVAMAKDLRVTQDHYMAFYGDTDQPDMHENMMDFMLDRPIRLLLVCGQQENSALQLMKTYLRYVVRHPVTRRTIRNWIHVTNPDASNYAELLAMYARA